MTNDEAPMTNGVRWQEERLTRAVRRVAGRYGPVARAPHCDKRSPSIPLPLRGEGSQWRRDRQLGRFGCERNML